MMSTALSTSRANSRTSKEKNSKALVQLTHNMKTEGPPKVQPTPEQIRLALISDRSDQDDADRQKIQIEQVMEATGKTCDEAAVALHDTEFDLEKAVIMLLEGENEGEWKKSGKKKKRINAAVTQKPEPISNHVADHRPEIRERSKDRDHRTERPEFGHRRNHRNGPLAPRYARGRGRDKGDFNFRENEDEIVEDGSGRERSFERGRGRGRGGLGRRGRGPRSFRSQRFDKGPQIDTWTNETAEMVNSTWNETQSSEDWNEDSWTGSSMDATIIHPEPVMCDPPFALSESKVFTASSVQQVDSSIISSGSPPVNDTTNATMPQRLDIGALLSKSTDQVTEAQYIAQYNQQATESLKNTIGIGTARQNSASISAVSTQSPNAISLSTLSQTGVGRLPAGVSTHTVSTQSIAAATAAVTMASQHSMQQRPKPSRSKLPPPSKIPASAVEMPRHSMPQLDVQFGSLEFGADSSPLPFGVNYTSVTSSFTTSVTNSTSPPSMSNHLSSGTQSSESVITSSIMSVSSPSNKATTMSHLDQTPPRSNIFQNSYTTTTKKEVSQTPLGQPNKMRSPDPISYPPSQTDRKSSPLIGSNQRPGQTPGTLNQGSVTSNKADTNSLGSFAQSANNYQTTSYQSHKPAGLSSTQSYTHSSNSLQQSNTAYQTQYQASQNQYHNAQPQYGHPSYQSSSSFQSQANYPGTQTGQNSLYQPSTQTSSYHPRDSQSAASFQTAVTQSVSASYQKDSPSGLTTPTSQGQSAYASQTYGSSHQSGLQTSPLSGNKLSESLSKMNVKDTSLDNSQSSTQYDHTTSATTTTVNLTPPTSTTSLANASTAGSVVATCTSVPQSTKSTPLQTNTKAPPNLPPGVPLLGTHQYIMGQGAIPPYFQSLTQGLQQPLYTSYEELQLLQQRLPPLAASSYYDMAFPVPTTLTGRDQATLSSVPYSGADNKLSRVDAQSPIPTTQQQSTQSAHQQPYINLHYPPYYYPSVLPGAGFQYHTMFAMPPVTNTAHAGNTGNTQYQKTYGSHAYGAGKGYDDFGQDFTKAGYGSGDHKKGFAGVSSVATAAAASADIPVTGYSKSHAQAFEKQNFHTGTPPPFSLPLATGTQAGSMGGPTTPYVAPFVPMVAHQTHSQLLHHPLQQDSTGSSSRVSQQGGSQPKSGGSKSYGTTYWTGGS